MCVFHWVVCDESEIRGPRKTFAMPGRIIQSLKKAERQSSFVWMKLINYPTAIKAIPLRL
jgi:hypothetical protein